MQISILYFEEKSNQFLHQDIQDLTCKMLVLEQFSNMTDGTTC